MSPRVVLPIHGAPPPEPPWGGLGDEGWARGSTFLEFAAAAGAHRDSVEAAFRDLAVPGATAEFLARYPHRVRILALVDTARAPALLDIARAERLCTLSTHLWMRIFAAVLCPDLVQRYAAAGETLPLFVFFGADRREFARWGRDSDAAQAADTAGIVLVGAFHARLAAHAPGSGA